MEDIFAHIRATNMKIGAQVHGKKYNLDTLTKDRIP